MKIPKSILLAVFLLSGQIKKLGKQKCGGFSSVTNFNKEVFDPTTPKWGKTFIYPWEKFFPEMCP
jgi:hypothetical protein